MCEAAEAANRVRVPETTDATNVGARCDTWVRIAVECLRPRNFKMPFKNVGYE